MSDQQSDSVEATEQIANNPEKIPTNGHDVLPHAAKVIELTRGLLEKKE